MIYEYLCGSCGAKKEEFRKVKDRNRAPKCDCGSKMEKQISSCGVQPDFQPYYDEDLQAAIKSRRHRQQVMREQGVSEKFGKGWY